jgi:serine/threonine protein kinase
MQQITTERQLPTPLRRQDEMYKRLESQNICATAFPHPHYYGFFPVDEEVQILDRRKGQTITKTWKTYALIMEYNPHTQNLKNYLKKTDIPLEIRYQICKDIIEGIRCLHNHHLVHGDLSLGNIIIDTMTYKIQFIDFSCHGKKPIFLLDPFLTFEMGGTISFPDDGLQFRWDRMRLNELYQLGIILYTIMKNINYISHNKSQSEIQAMNQELQRFFANDYRLSLLTKKASDRYIEPLRIKKQQQFNPSSYGWSSIPADNLSAL